MDFKHGELVYSRISGEPVVVVGDGPDGTVRVIRVIASADGATYGQTDLPAIVLERFEGRILRDLEERATVARLVRPIPEPAKLVQ